MQANVAFWKTYMPPPHLLAIPQADVDSGKVRLRDYAGASKEEVSVFLHGLATDTGVVSVTYLVTPPQAFGTLPFKTAKCFSEEQRFYPHLDLDHIDESRAIGWPQGLSLGVYIADSNCLL